MRHAARTDANHLAISDALREAGYGVWYIRWPTDLLVRTKGGWLPMEIKVPGGKLTEDQEKFIASAGNCPVSIVDTPEAAIRAARAME